MKKVRERIDQFIYKPVSIDEEDDPYGRESKRRYRYKYIEFGNTKIPAANLIAATISEVIDNNPYKVFTI